ncbi:MAG: hypothetical protein GQ574_09470 [Crocinitomix sp.]|nr:hypothetical protein [Crocinitomix sp.]
MEIDKGLSVENVRNSMLDSLNGQLKTELNHVMDELCGDGQMVRIDCLELDLGNVTPQNLNHGLIEELRSELRKAVVNQYGDDIRKAQANDQPGTEGGVELITEVRIENDVPVDRTLNSFVFFLETGTFPWWATLHSLKEIETYVTEDLFIQKSENQTAHAHALKKVLHVITANTRARKRFFQQLPTAIIIQFSEQWFGSKSKQYSAVMQWLLIIFRPIIQQKETTLTSYLHLAFINQLLSIQSETRQKAVHEIIAGFVKEYLVITKTSFSSKQISTLKALVLNQEKIKQLKKAVNKPNQKELIALVIAEIQTHQKTRSKAPITESVKKQGENKVESEKERIKEEPELFDIAAEFGYAGAVILWPMLTTFFKSRNLIEGKAFKDEAAQAKALQLLNYLVSGFDELPEFEMPLNKILCGIPIKEVIIFDTELTEDDKTEINALLEHVITNWSVLKNTTPRGLREGFIFRKGELTEFEESWLLTVEQKGIDIIMNKLPWGYSMIKLPWMDKILQVQW